MSDKTTEEHGVRSFQVDDLAVRIYPDSESMAAAAAAAARLELERLLAGQKEVAVVLASAASQERFLEVLTAFTTIDWSRVTLFHMDEYLGIDPGHPASFRRFLRERVEAVVRPKAFHYLCGEADQPLDECERYAGLLQSQSIDLCCLGIGENGHLAFNDPPVADFQDGRVVKLVRLDRVCRQQQVGEGAFPELDAVPKYAFTLTIPELCRARRLICVVPDSRKANAVSQTLTGPIASSCPATALRQTSQATLYLDAAAASLLS